MLSHCVLIGGSNDECKPGGVMVEFDDGDRGWISLRNTRLLPPGYQIHCGSLILSHKPYLSRDIPHLKKNKN